MRSASFFLTGLYLLSAVACASILGDDFTIETGGGGSPGSGGDAGTGGMATTGGAGGTGGMGAGGAPDGGGGAGGEDCEVVVAPPVPLDMALLVDRTGSMGNNGRWNTLKTELGAFFQTPGWARIAVALNLFEAPLGQACQLQGYDPMQVPLNDMPANAPVLVNYLNMFTPTGQTTITPAIQGTLDWAAGHFASASNHRVVAVILADGTLSTCGGGFSVMLAAAQMAASLGVPTYTVSLDGSATGELDQIAAAGGTSVFFHQDSVGVRGALEQIRDDALHCAHSNETGVTDADDLDASLIVGGTPLPLPHVAAAGACSGDGWYFPQSNTDRILLCPASCARVTDDLSIALELRYDCR